MATAAAFAVASPVRIIRMIDTRETHDLPLDLLRQETVELRVRASNYGAPVDLSGWTVTLHGRTNGQSAAESYQAAGVAGIAGEAGSAAAGWMSVRVDVDAWWPHGADSGVWTLAATNAADRIMRAGGPLAVRGTAAADARVSLPQSVADSLRIEIHERPTFAEVADMLAESGIGGASGAAISAIDALRLIQADTNAWIAVESGSPWLYSVSSDTSRVYIASAGSAWDGPPVGTALAYSTYSDPASYFTGTWGVTAELLAAVGGGPVILTATLLDPPGEMQWTGAGDLPASLAGAEPGNTCVLDYMPLTNATRIATEDYVAAAIQTYFLSSNAWITITTNVLSVHAVTGGASQASIVWSSAESTGSQGIDPDATNLLWQALSAGLGEKADKDWGKYGPDGSINPDPSYQTWLNAPATAFAGGLQWATYATYSVLATAGAVAFVGDQGGEVRIGIDLYTNYIGFAQGQSITVGARAESIHVVSGGTPEGYATIVYDYESGDFPVMWMCLALSDTWQAIDEGVIWVDNGDGSATVTVPATSGTAFYMATTSRNLSCVVFSKPPFRFDGGILGGTNALPVVYDSVITISSGGKQYLIPAQEAP